MILLIGGLALALHAALMLAAAPMLPALGEWLEAVFRRQPPPSPWAGVRELRALTRKRVPRPEAASAIFRLAPCLAAAAAFAAALLVPSFTPDLPTAPLADLLLIATLLALSEAATQAGGLDPGTWPAAEAASASLARLGLAAPVLAVCLLDLAVATGGTNLPASMRGLGDASRPPVLALGLTLTAILLLLPRPARLPDEFAATTGLELEAGGVLLALCRYTAQLRRLIALTLLADLVPPYAASLPGGWIGGLLAWALKLALLEAGLRAASRLPLPPIATRATLALALAATAGLFLALGQPAA